MRYRAQRTIVEDCGRRLTRRLLPGFGRARVVSLTLSVVVAAAGCGTDEPPAEDFRCRIAKADGACESLPANCPVTVPKGITVGEPHCPEGAELIPLAADDCAQKGLCTD